MGARSTGWAAKARALGGRHVGVDEVGPAGRRPGPARRRPAESAGWWTTAVVEFGRHAVGLAADHLDPVAPGGQPVGHLADVALDPGEGVGHHHVHDAQSGPAEGRLGPQRPGQEEPQPVRGRRPAVARAARWPGPRHRPPRRPGTTTSRAVPWCLRTYRSWEAWKWVSRPHGVAAGAGPDVGGRSPTGRGPPASPGRRPGAASRSPRRRGRTGRRTGRRRRGPRTAAAAPSRSGSRAVPAAGRGRPPRARRPPAWGTASATRSGTPRSGIALGRGHGGQAGVAAEGGVEVRARRPG